MRGYYGDEISANRTRTPEGFLICHETPIARTGTQEYLRREIGLSGDGVIEVHRDETEVFAKNAITSFEGKPITDEHPKQNVDTCNYGAYMKGVVKNVRRKGDKLIADLVIHDANLIAEIEAGKREISCGYECRYEIDAAGEYHQTHIIGNHVAVVDRGRAGSAVRIRDEKMKGDKDMKKNILQRMFDKFVKDADPEEIKEAAKAVSEAEETKDDEPEETKDEETDVKELAKTVDALAKTVDGLSAILLSQQKNTLDELEEELTKDDGEEQAEDDEPESKETEDDDEGEETTAQDKAVALAAIRAVKPIVAALPVNQRQKATDAMTKAIRDALKQPSPKNNTYALMNKRKTTDSAKLMNDRQAFGENCRKYNPHLKGAK